MNRHLLPVLLLCFCLRISNSVQVQCHSCFAQCEMNENGTVNAQTCDCRENLCRGQFCFAKIDIFEKELIATIQKGCSSFPSSGQSGCHFSGRFDSIHCWCSSNLCNVHSKLGGYLPTPLPTVDCCLCSESQGDRCPENTCINTCKGNYCLIDLNGVNQNCGWGVPPLMTFLRSIDNSRWQGTTTCAKWGQRDNSIAML